MNSSEKSPGADQLLQEARKGNGRFLEKILKTHKTKHPSYFYSQCNDPAFGDEIGYNMIHLAIKYKREEFLEFALQNFPRLEVQKLLWQKVNQSSDNKDYNAFHLAADLGNFAIVKQLVAFAKEPSSSASSTASSTSSATASESKLWLDTDGNGKTPFDIAIHLKWEECAIELMSLDKELFRSTVNYQGNSYLFQAVRENCDKVAMRILRSNTPYNTISKDRRTPLDVAPYCSERVCKKLLEKHPEMIKMKSELGSTLLHKWVRLDRLKPFELLLNQHTTSSWTKEDFLHLLCMTEKFSGNNPLHIAAYRQTEESVEIVKLLVESYRSYKNEIGDDVLLVNPWEQSNSKGETPLFTALILKHEKLALYYLSLDDMKILEDSSKSILYEAVRSGCDEVVDTILENFDKFQGMALVGSGGQNVLHIAWKCKGKTPSLLISKLPSSLIKHEDDNGNTPLDIASEVGTVNRMKLLLKQDPSSLRKTAWIKACKKGYLSTVKALIDHSDNNFIRHCVEVKDTPLHHIVLESYTDYKQLLELPIFKEMRVMRDFNNDTPLDKALATGNNLLAEVLLSTDDVSTSITSDRGNTS